MAATPSPRNSTSVCTGMYPGVYVFYSHCPVSFLLPISPTLSDVYGFHTHGPSDKEAESESCRERAGTREGNGRHQLSQTQREEEEGEEVLLREKERRFSKNRTDQWRVEHPKSVCAHVKEPGHYMLTLH